MNDPDCPVGNVSNYGDISKYDPDITQTASAALVSLQNMWHVVMLLCPPQQTIRS